MLALAQGGCLNWVATGTERTPEDDEDGTPPNGFVRLYVELETDNGAET